MIIKLLLNLFFIAAKNLEEATIVLFLEKLKTWVTRFTNWGAGNFTPPPNREDHFNSETVLKTKIFLFWYNFLFCTLRQTRGTSSS
jgi:hypothetical protein